MTVFDPQDPSPRAPAHLVAADDTALRERLQPAIARQFTNRRTLVSWRWEPSGAMTSYASYRLLLQLDDGTRLPLFVKDFGIARNNKGVDRRERERFLYREVLATEKLGTPAFYGDVWEKQRRRFWLLLEWVEGQNLHKLEPTIQLEAARWLARFHRRMSTRHFDESQRALLLQQDEAGLMRDIERARLQFERHLPAKLSVIERAGLIVHKLSQQVAATPKILLQGECKLSQILMAGSADDPRLASFDWERASWGPPASDLAALIRRCHPSRREGFVRAYLAEAEQQGLSLPAAADFEWMLEHFEVYHLVRSLRAALKHRRDRPATPTLLQRLGELVERLGTPTAAWQPRSVTTSPRVSVGRRRLPDGVEVDLVQKELHCHPMTHPDKRCWDRELTVYRRWLRGVGDRVPRLIDWQYRAGGAGASLYVEFVAGQTLDQLAFPLWQTAARALGSLHAQWLGQPRPDRHQDILLTVDQAYCWRWFQRAHDNLALQSPAAAERLEDLRAHYAALLPLLMTEPATLIHNDLAPQNVLIAGTGATTRTCFVDWELAGWGPGILDLAHLADGFPVAQQQELRDAYTSGLREGAPTVEIQPAGASAFTAAVIHRYLYRLGRSHAHNVPLQRREAWLSVIEDQLRMDHQPPEGRTLP